MPSAPKRPRRLTTALALVVFSLVAVGVLAGSAGAEAPKNNDAPTVSDTRGNALSSVKVGDLIQGNNGSWFCTPPYPGMDTCKYDFQWQRCDAGGSSCVNIAGATTQQRTVQASDVGSRLRVMVTATNYDCNALRTECRYVSVSAPSGQTPVVQGTAAPPAAVAAPAATAAPAITGIAMERDVLTATDGTWTGTAPVTISRQWLRCNTAGAACVAIPEATAQTYTLTAEDVGRTIRIQVVATNAGGSTSSTSAPTPAVAALAPRPGRMTLGIDDVSLPQRLVIDRTTFAPNPLRSRDSFTARFRVSDTRGFRISGALVQVVSVPFGMLRRAPEVETDANGWATFTLTPTAKLPLTRNGSLVLFLRARKAGENPLAGVSTRRLVRVKTAAPFAP